MIDRLGIFSKSRRADRAGAFPLHTIYCLLLNLHTLAAQVSDKTTAISIDFIGI